MILICKDRSRFNRKDTRDPSVDGNRRLPALYKLVTVLCVSISQPF